MSAVSTCPTPYTNFVKSLHDNVAAIREMDFHLLVVGNFNFSSINWSMHDDGTLDPADYMVNDPNGSNAEFVHTMNCFNLSINAS